MTKYILTAAVLLLITATLTPAQTLTDPYEILGRHYEALGGLEKLKAETSSHFEGTLSVAGLTGTIRVWTERPGRSRTEVDLKVVQQTMGDNGEVAWEVDPNGKLRIEKDKGALTMREIDRRINEYEHLDQTSDIFILSFEGVEELDGTECYAVKVASSIDDGYIIEYIDTSTFLLKKSSNIRDNRETHTVYSDFREVSAILRPFRQVTEEHPIPQTQTLELTSYEANVAIDPALFEPPREDVEDFVFAGGGDMTEVPFQFIEKHLYLTVTINCIESLWILDTGASMSVIDSEFAEELGLVSEGNIKGMGAGHAVDVSFVSLPPYSVGGIEFGEQKAASLPISNLFETLSNIEVGGILGYDFLSRFVTRIDYANETLTFFNPKTFKYTGQGVVLDGALRGNMFTVPASVDGTHHGRWSLDLGASGCSFHYPYAEKHGLLNLPAIEGIGFGAGGRMTKKLAKFDSFEFAGSIVDDPRLSFPVENMVGAFGTTELIGNLGNTLFRHFVLYLDYEHQQVIVEKGGNFGYDFSVDKSGLQVWTPEGEDLQVLFVSPGTPAEAAGLKEADVIKAINGIGFQQLDGPNAVRELLRTDSGTKYMLDILRDGDPMRIEITLRDLL